MKNLIIEQISNKLNTITDKDIYAFNLYLEYYNDNPYEPTITFGYNTIENYENACKETDELEAKWNYAFWLQNEIFVLGIDETKNIVKNWFLKNNLGYKTYEEFFDNEIDEKLCDKIDKKIKKEMVEAIKEIQNSNIIKNQFNKEIPIIIHELEYTNELAKLNENANSKNSVKEFVQFCKGNY